MMGSTWAFKTTASIIKPTRETLLDYVAYILLVLSIIGIARVMIGSSDLSQSCLGNVVKLPASSNEKGLDIIFSGSSELGIIRNSQMEFITRQSDVVILAKTTSPALVALENVTFPYCAKYYQAHFAYALVGEAIVLLLVGIMWVKMPRVQSLVQNFSDLLHESSKSEWFKNLPTSVDSKSLVISNKHDFHIVLKELFRSTTHYSDKAKARCLYEKIQKFSCEHEHSQSLLTLYIRKSVLQFVLWLASVSINAILYIKLEFYFECKSVTDWCSHDTFLRIVWFLAQSLLLIYGVFNCATLKWIAKNSSSKGLCASCLFCCGCLKNNQASPSQYFHCQSYSVFNSSKTVHNDMALLLHLASSSNHELLIYFTVFLFDEWAGKFFVTNDHTFHIESESNFNENHTLLGSSSHGETSADAYM